MKNKFTILITILFAVALMGLCGWYCNHYTRNAKYIGDGRFIDKQGYIWCYDGDFLEGHSYKLRMHNNGTDTIITDDKIEKIRFIK